MADDFVYKPVEARDRESLLASFESSDPKEVSQVLYSATYHDPDWRWVQEWCLKFLKSDHAGIRWAAATCLGDLAVFHKQLDLDLVLPALNAARSDPSIASTVEDRLSFITQAVKSQ
jgi:hypothetical protein